MELTATEQNVVERLRKCRITTMKVLQDDLAVSHMTVFRALKKYGYHTSINRNASFYTLRDTPRFDADGLWSYRDVCFSQYGSLGKTLVVLVENSAAGLTVDELAKRVQTKVGNALSRLCNEGALSRYLVGHQAVYLANDAPTGRRQQQERDRQQQDRRQAHISSDADRLALPPHYDVVTVLEVLIQVIKTPAANAAELAKSLRSRGVKITAVQVQRVLDFYSVKKKRHHRRRGTRAATDA